MTTPFERTRALAAAGDFLERLLTAKSTTMAGELQEEARRILRHYPSSSEIAFLAELHQHTNALLPMLDPDAIPLELRKGYRR